MSKTILVQNADGGEFKITIPEESSLTFGPFSPPSKNGDRSPCNKKVDDAEKASR